MDELDAATLSSAFRGALVPQDSNDEPADATLARLAAERDTPEPRSSGKGAKKRRGKAAA